MFWELYQQSQISRAKTTAGRAERNAERAIERTRQAHELMESKVESLALTCQALIEILEESTGLTEDQLAAKMEEIDLRDGVKDGRITPTNKVCSKCGRRTSRTRAHCLYCGGATEPESQSL